MRKTAKTEPKKKPAYRFERMTNDEMIALLRAAPEPKGSAKTWQVVSGRR